MAWAQLTHLLPGNWGACLQPGGDAGHRHLLGPSPGKCAKTHCPPDRWRRRGSAVFHFYLMSPYVSFYYPWLKQLWLDILLAFPSYAFSKRSKTKMTNFSGHEVKTWHGPPQKPATGSLIRHLPGRVSFWLQGRTPQVSTDFNVKVFILTSLTQSFIFLLLHEYRGEIPGFQRFKWLRSKSDLDSLPCNMPIYMRSLGVSLLP